MKLEMLEPREGEFDVLQFGSWGEPKEIDGQSYPRFVVDSDQAYPAMIERIRSCVESYEKQGRTGVVAQELVDRHVHEVIHPNGRYRTLIGEAAKLPKEAWDLALTPQAEVTDEQKSIIRSMALELARFWFTRAFNNRKSAAASKTVLKFVKSDERWRLGPEPIAVNPVAS